MKPPDRCLKTAVEILKKELKEIEEGISSTNISLNAIEERRVQSTQRLSEYENKAFEITRVIDYLTSGSKRPMGRK